MVSNELISNSRQHMIETLMHFASIERQRSYASAVPFVHVPKELACQWDQHSALINKQPWFRNSLSEVELKAALTFDSAFKKVMSNFTLGLPDLEDISSNPLWSQLGLDAQAALRNFQR